MFCLFFKKKCWELLHRLEVVIVASLSLVLVESQVKANILNVDLQGRNSRTLFTWFLLPCGTARLKSVEEMIYDRKWKMTTNLSCCHLPVKFAVIVIKFETSSTHHCL